MEIEFTAIDQAIVQRAADVIAAAKRAKKTLATAESCTGGLLASVISEAPGAADQFHGGFVTYTKQQKTMALGVPADMLARESAVSAVVARAMAEGALARSGADLAVAITGVAGPAADEDGNPVGLVYLAIARRGAETSSQKQEFGDIGRGAVRYRSAMAALDLLDRTLSA